MIAAIGLLALVVRLGAIAATPHLSLAADPRDYDRHAREIAATAHYPSSAVAPAGGPTAIRPPGFPYLLGGVYALTGNSVTAARVAQAGIGALAAVLLALISLDLFGFRAAVVTGVLGAVFPPLVIDGITLLSEPLFVLLELAAVLAVLRWRRSNRMGWIAVAGMAIGLAVLTRANGLALLVVLAFATTEAGSRRTVRAWRAPAVLVGCAVLVVLPWTIRNAIEFDSFVPVSTQDGYTLIGTYNATSRARDAIWIPGNIDPSTNALLQRNRDLDEAALNAKLRSEARHFAVDDPAYVVEVAGRNLLRLFNLGGAGYERAVAAGDYALGSGWGAVMTWSLIPVLILAAVGVTTRAARTVPRWLWVLPVLLLSTVFVLATNRHRAAIDPFLLILAALAIVAGISRLRGSERAPEGPDRIRGG